MDAAENVEVIRHVVRFLGIRFGTLFCLMGIRIEHLAASGDKPIFRHVGYEVELVG